MSRATRLRTIKYKCVLKFAYAEKANAAVFINNSLKKAKPRFCLFPSICRYLGSRKGVKTAALNNMRVLINAAVRGKPLVVPLKIAEICFVSSKQISRALYFTILLQNSRKNYTSGRYTESTKFNGVKKKL